MTGVGGPIAELELVREQIGDGLGLELADASMSGRRCC
jgi:hypothetical protein